MAPALLFVATLAHASTTAHALQGGSRFLLNASDVVAQGDVDFSSSKPFPSGSGLVAPGFFSTSRAWTGTDGEPIRAHSGMVLYDTAKKQWRWAGNSDQEERAGGSQNTQIAMYSSEQLEGPWGHEEVLLTVEQAQSLPGVGSDIQILERPKVYQRHGSYYLFVHLDDASYRQRKLGVFKMSDLSAPSESNPWTTVFAGNPGENKNRQGSGFEVCDFNIYFDKVTGQLLYASTTDSFVWASPNYCDTEVSMEECRADSKNCRDCYNTAVVVFSVDLKGLERGTLEAESFLPLATLPGRWEGISLFRKPGDDVNIYMLCSGQDGFGSNPVSLFAGPLGSRKKGLMRERRLLKRREVQSTPYDWPAPQIFDCLGQPFSGSANAFNSQPTQVLENPYDPDFAVYIGDNWLHGPGRESSSLFCPRPSEGEDLLSGRKTECEPWAGACPCGWPDNTCPSISNPGTSAGYVWLSFPWRKIGLTDYLICAHASWNLRSPPKHGESPCYTFNIFPDADHTPGFEPMRDYGGSGSQAPFVRSSCGFVACPGWPLSPSENDDPNCCARLGDAITSAKFLGGCWRRDVCGGRCNDTDYGNIPGGDGQCRRQPFNAKKATLLGGHRDCTRARDGVRGVVDSCRGDLRIPR